MGMSFKLINIIMVETISYRIIMRNISSISNLEANILLIIWDRGEVTVRTIWESLLKEKDSNLISYITIMSTMSNLARKKILKIDRTKKTYIHSAAISRKELVKSIIRTVSEKLL